MYFTKPRRVVCHIMEDADAGRAPAPCGSRVDKMDWMKYLKGKPSPNISTKQPAGVPLCKHCEKASEWRKEFDLERPSSGENCPTSTSG